MRWILNMTVVLAAAAAVARSPEREIIPLSVTWDVGLGNQVYVTGNHADLGYWNPVDALRLRWTSGNVWTGQVAVQKGTALEYKFISRSGASNVYCSAGNVIWEAGPNRSNSLAAAPAAPYAGKTIYYYSAWTSVNVVTVEGANFPSYGMVRAGPGLAPGEYLYRADGVGEAGEAVEFAMNGWLNGTQGWDNPPPGEGWGPAPGNYRTTLDVFVLRGGKIYSYWPVESVSAPRAETRYVDSSYPPIDGRTVRILLPRGYDSHPWKRYPVIYMQDGQNMTNGANPGGTGAWDADLISQREINQGRMREIIMVGVDNYPERRRWEYNPLGDQYPGEQPGRADAYLNFLANNVRPTIDTHYRTLNDFRNTFVGGSSMGGIFSIYAGFETNVFGGLLAMSPAVTRAPNYRNALPGKSKRPMRIYLDTGTSEGQIGTPPGGYYWDDPWSAYVSFLTMGYAPPEDLMMRIGCGHGHNEAAWRARLPDAFRWLFDVRDDPNTLAQQRWPSEVTAFGPGGVVSFRTQEQFAYHLQAAPVPDGVWSNVATRPAEMRPWDSGTLTNPPSADRSLYRLSAESVP